MQKPEKLELKRIILDNRQPFWSKRTYQDLFNHLHHRPLSPPTHIDQDVSLYLLALKLGRKSLQTVALERIRGYELTTALKNGSFVSALDYVFRAEIRYSHSGIKQWLAGELGTNVSSDFITKLWRNESFLEKLEHTYFVKGMLELMGSALSKSLQSYWS